MSTEILKGHDARIRIKAGVDAAADAVRPTLGPVGMTALIEFKGLDPVLCDDGVTILRNLDFKDPYENMGLQMLRKAALRTSAEGGDGTATTTVLTQALVCAAFKELEHDSSRIREVRTRLTEGLTETIEAIRTLNTPISEDDIERIAMISTLDAEAAKLIAEIIKEVGVNGVVTVEKSSSIGYSKEVVKGARFERGLISPYFINDHEHKQTVLEDAYIVLVDRKVSTNEQILSLLNSIGTGKDILFIADDIDSVALASLVQNAVKGIANIGCVRNPYTASRARDFLFDIAALTGATVISEESGMKLNEQTALVCGRAEKVIITRDTTTIIGGKLGPSYTARITALEGEIVSTTSEYEKKLLIDRLAQLTGGIGVIRVGAYTDTEFNEKKYKFDNGINSTQAALQEGIVPGGGMTFLSASCAVKEPIFKEALQAPFYQMLKNAGMQTEDFTLNKLGPDGINFKTKEIVNLVEAGIIDPFKVLRIALESATSVAASLVSVETALVKEELNAE